MENFLFQSEKINFSITQNALQQIKNILNKYLPVAYKLKISVQGGGCAGFSYNFKLIEASEDEDIVINTNNTIILIDEPSAELLNNCCLDYIQKIGNSSFVITRPNELKSNKCGCGNSFTI